jgi:hypothetical protein
LGYNKPVSKTFFLGFQETQTLSTGLCPSPNTQINYVTLIAIFVNKLLLSTPRFVAHGPSRDGYLSVGERPNVTNM